MKNVFCLCATIASVGLSTPAMAQDEGSRADFYAGGQSGYHIVGNNPFGSEGGLIFGGYAGVDFGNRVIFGIEGNVNAGTDLIESEYGLAVKLGIRTSETSQVFVRVGYQEVAFNANQLIDAEELFGFPLPDIGVSDGDYLVGVGGQLMVAENISLRTIIDTVGFDTARGTIGVAFHF